MNFNSVPKTYAELLELDQHYRNVSIATCILWMSSKRRAGLLRDIRRTHTDAITSVRQPFIPPYTAADLPQLDTLMAAVGMDLEWRRSGARNRLMAQRSNIPEPTISKQYLSKQGSDECSRTAPENPS